MEASKSPLPTESQMTGLIPPQQFVRTGAKYCLPGSLLKILVLREFRGSSHRYPPPSTYQNSILPERKQVLNINNTVYTNSVGTVSHSLFGESLLSV